MRSTTAPDIILTSGKITTLDRARPETRELAIKDGRIITGGERGPATRVIDLGGRRVIPGLNDSHPHVIRALVIARSDWTPASGSGRCFTENSAVESRRSIPQSAGTELAAGLR